MSFGEQKNLLFDEPDRENLLASLELKRPLVFFDLETTGLDPQNDRIVQFAFLRVNPDRSQDEWKELVNPGVSIPPEATRVHHITNDMVAAKPLFKDFAPLILDFVDNCDLSGFNIARFDVPFLLAEMERNDHALDVKKMNIIDVQVIYHKNEPRDLSAAYRYYCGRDHIDAHDAMGDVRVTLEILDAQLKKYTSIPKSTKGLHKYCEPRDSRFVTTDRKFYWKNNEAVLSFGKHKGRSLQWLVENERDYLLWMLNGDFTDETKAVIDNAMRGVFPAKASNEDEA
ncbi:3'-5' exonuclease [candidate division KSB1 bacterium]|nr:3'-5' exonuclease [candidate division KSB1 bacterium]